MFSKRSCAKAENFKMRKISILQRGIFSVLHRAIFRCICSNIHNSVYSLSIQYGTHVMRVQYGAHEMWHIYIIVDKKQCLQQYYKRDFI
jgi:hypothetical protein